MANTTKSTRTTKTTKAKKAVAKKAPAKAVKAAKTTKTAASKKVTETKKAPAAAKAVVSKESAKKAPVALGPLDRLRSVHIAFGTATLIFAAIVAWAVSIPSVGARLGFVTKDEFASKTDTVLNPTHEILFNIRPEFVLIAALVVSGLASILFASRLRARYEAGIKNEVSSLRWLALGLSGGLTIEFVGLLTGVYDVLVLKATFALLLVTTLLGVIAERDNKNPEKLKLAYGLGLFTGTIAWLPIIGSLIGTALYGSQALEAYVYGVAGVTLLGFIGFAFNQYRHLAGKTQSVYADVEARYLRIDFVTKFAVVLILVLTFVTK